MSGFSKLFWGFLIILLDFRLQNFDILPDIIGYLMIYSGLGQLFYLSEHFNFARKYTVPLAILSLFDIVQFQRPISFDPTTGVMFIVGIVTAVIDLMMVYHICVGIAKAAVGINQLELEQIAMNRWKYYLVAKLAFLVTTPVMLMNTQLFGVIAIPLIVISLIIMILIVLLMKKADETFSRDQFTD